MFEYLVPVVEIQIGDFLVRRTVELRLVTGRANPVDRARIVLPVQGLDPSVVELDAPVQIRAGYREKGLWPLFTGTVCDLAWSQQVRLLCRTGWIPWSVRITQAFVDATPKDVVSKVLDVAGVTNRQISDSVQDRRHYYVLSGQNAIESIRLVNRSWGLEDWAFFFSPEPDGGFWWGPWEESPRNQDGEVLRLEHGKNILELTPFNRERRGVVQTSSSPTCVIHSWFGSRICAFGRMCSFVRASSTRDREESEDDVEWTLVSWVNTITAS